MAAVRAAEADERLPPRRGSSYVGREREAARPHPERGGLAPAVPEGGGSASQRVAHCLARR